jgi:uncharacterized protein involved in cysteine biosynthesis
VTTPGDGYTAGFALVRDAFALLRSERRLWVPAAWPVALTALLLVVGVALGLAAARELAPLVAAQLPRFAADARWEWAWVAPARAVVWLAEELLFVAVVLASLVAALVAANVLAAPFHEQLSQRVEQLAGSAGRGERGGVRTALSDAFRAVREELKRTAFLAALWLAIVGAGVLVPGAQLLVGPALTLATCFFLPLDHASYALDRRRLSFAQKRRWLAARPRTTLGFGVAGFASCALPGLNLLALPVLVTAGTLYVLRHPPGEAVS